uniref:Uncharacterized protein n=1 Tax=Ananas comosus var. bracteatus TaxID=296719 RepID=A0A6V7PA30_ANACO|nr:unnamed protein product [Ananas comosus var. bracteatus]
MRQQQQQLQLATAAAASNSSTSTSISSSSPASSSSCSCTSSSSSCSQHQQQQLQPAAAAVAPALAAAAAAAAGSAAASSKQQQLQPSSSSSSGSSSSSASAEQQQQQVRDCYGCRGWKRRTILVGFEPNSLNDREAVLKLKEALSSVVLSDSPDVVKCRWTQFEMFTVNSLYKFLQNGGGVEYESIEEEEVRNDTQNFKLPSSTFSPNEDIESEDTPVEYGEVNDQIHENSNEGESSHEGGENMTCLDVLQESGTHLCI